MLRRGCKYNSHLIRDCPTIRKADLVKYVLQTGEDAGYLTIDQLLYTVQDLPDDVWLLKCENSSEPDITCSPEDNTEPLQDHTDDISRTVYTRLVALLDKHEILREIQTNDVMTLAYDLQRTESDSQPTSVPITSQSLPHMNASIQARVTEGMKRNDQKCKGVMIDNGTVKPPSGLPAYIRYCIHTGTMPELRPSNRDFPGICHCIMRSLGTATIRMPMDPGLFQNFDVDVLDHDVPAIFGLEHNWDLKCSSNEHENTFNHHPSGTVTPLTFLNEGNGPVVFSIFSCTQMTYCLQKKSFVRTHAIPASVH